MIMALMLIFQHFIPVNNKIIIVNVTYGPQGKFVSEMVMIQKKQYEELQNEFHNMETDNMNLVHQISLLRAKPLSYYENQANKIKNEANDIENEDSNHIKELKRNSPGYIIQNEVTKTMTNISKNKLNTTISVQTINMTKYISKLKFNATISTQNKETTKIPKRELNTTIPAIPVQMIETMTTIPKVKFNMTNISQIIKTTIVFTKNECNKTNSIQDFKLATNMTKEDVFNTINSRQIMKTSMKNISNHEFNTKMPIQDIKTMTNIKHKFNKTSKTNTELKKHKFNTILVRLVETTRDISTLVSHTSGDKQTLKRFKEANKLNCAVQKEMNNLKRQCNETNNFLFEFKWKMLIIQTIADYEADFDKLELRQVQPPFQLNQTLVRKTIESWRYDPLAERRRQRWKFYLKTSPYCDNTFERLAKRIKRSNFSIEEFCQALATLHKLISLDSHLETIKPSKLACGFLYQYKKMHFVISMLLEDYPKTELVKNIFKELKV